MLLNNPEIFQIGITYSQMSIRVVLRVFRNLSRFNFTLYLKNPLFPCLIAFQFGFGMNLKPNSSCLVPTGLAVAFSSDFEIQIRPRSGLAAKNSISVLNTPGTIDSDYRGEIKVILFNHGKNDFLINNKDRIAQMILTPVIKMDLEETDDLPETIRGEGGFDSTGK